MAMNPEIKARWVAALRSGKYKQTKGFLRCDESFCCLGVLCDVVEPEYWNGEDYAIDPHLPAERLTDGVGIDYVDVLTHMNDHEGETFRAIADYIEREL